MNSTAKLKWHCRRGTKELDFLLENYLVTSYNQATEKEQSLFRELLALQDSQLIWFLLGEQLPDSEELAKFVEKIRNNRDL